MNTKNMTKEEVEYEIELLNNIIKFNNKLNKFTRKWMKDRDMGWGKTNNFNGFYDEPTPEMKEAFTKFFEENDTNWMNDKLKRRYFSDMRAIFGDVYSIAVNTYHLKDLHDCEKFLNTIENAETNSEEENEMFKVKRDTNENRLNLHFEDIPDETTRTILKSNGFKWSPTRDCWTRQLTSNAENSLKRIKKALNIN